jgi:multiple sugar transport system permease protein
MRPLTTVVFGLALVASLKTFDIVWVMTQGGPGRTSETLAVTMYRQVFVADEYGYGSAIAVALTTVTGLASYVYLRHQLAREGS